jgi:hypothetical protein
MTRHTGNYRDLQVTEQEYRKRLEDSHLKSGFISTNIYRKDLDMWEEGCRFWQNLMTNDGRDRMHALTYTLTSLSGNAGFNNFAATTNTGAPAASDTALTGEITTNGLARVQANNGITHTTGTNSTLLSQLWTASGTFTAVVKIGLFNVATAPVSGTMGHEGTISSTDLGSGDKLQVDYTLNQA